MEADLAAEVRAVVRDIAATAKALRLYPPASPIPRESAIAAVDALGTVFDSVPILALGITKEGFAMAGEALDQAVASSDLAGMLQTHGVGEISFTPGCDVNSLVKFLGMVVRDPGEVTSEGGLGTLLASSGIAGIAVSDVHLTVVDGHVPEEGEDVDDFLRRLAQDPDKLTAWLSSATGGDLNTLSDSLLELAKSAGPNGADKLAEGLSQAFLAQDTGGRDALIGVALDDGPVRDLAADMLGRLSVGDLSETLCDGTYGQNMLSLSTAMTMLPIGERFSAMMEKITAMLPDYGHGDKELGFLEHMIETRKSTLPEPSLGADPTYQEVANRSSVGEEEFAAARAEFAGADAVARERTLATLLSLMDQQKDFDLYCQTLDSLAGLVPRLLDAGELELAARALSEIADRETRTDLPWPDVADRYRDALNRATAGTAMSALLEAVAKNAELVPSAHDILQVAGDAAAQTLVEEALNAREFDGFAVAEKVLGRRMNDLLPALVARVQWFQVAALATRLADQGDARSAQALSTLAAREDAQVRREVAKGLAASSNPAVLKPLGTLLTDSTTEVVVTAARGLAATDASGSAEVIVARLEDLDIDGKDFVIARELIAALARIQQPAAREYLESLASRKALIKRGHFAEIQDLAQRALQANKGGGRS